MRSLIVYNGRTGFTKQYAEWIAEAAQADVLSAAAATAKAMADYDTIVFGGRVHAGHVDGLKKAFHAFEKSGAKRFAVFAVGATPLEAVNEVEKIWRESLDTLALAGLPHFYMPGGMRFEGMSVMDSMILRMAKRMLAAGKKREGQDGVQEGFEQAISREHDISDRRYIQPLVDWLLEEMKSA